MEHVYFTIFIKMLAAFVVVVVYINISGKGALAPISALDQVGNFVFGAITGGAIYNPAISVLMLTVVSSLWAAMMLAVRYLTYKRRLIKNVVDGRSIPLMKNGRLMPDNFSRAGLSVRDFIMLLHQRGYSNLSGLRNIWFEYNGQMTVVEKGDDDMAIVLVEAGQVDRENLESQGLDDDWLMDEISTQGFRLDDIFMAEWHDGKLWIYPYGKNPD